MEKIIDISGAIGFDYAACSNLLNYELSNIGDVDRIRVNISSTGGDYIEAVKMFNMLRESRKKITCSAQGFVASAGAFLLLAGDTIECASNAVLMFHMPELSASKPMNADEMAKMSENMRAVEQSLVTSLCSRTKKTEEEIRNFLNKGSWLTPTEAKEMGLIDKILPFRRRKVELTANAPVEITNFVEQQNKECDTMNLKDLCGKLELKITDSATDEQMAELITNYVSDLQKKLEEAAKNVESAVTTPKAKLPIALLNMVKRSRESEIDGLVQSGKITAAVATDLKVAFVNDERINSSIDDEGRVLDAFEMTMDALKKNESVVKLGTQTGVQQLGKGSDDKKNPLIADAESRK